MLTDTYRDGYPTTRVIRCISWEVIGDPAPQGSKRFVGLGSNGKGKMIESSKKVGPWREAVKWSYLQRFGAAGAARIEGPVSLSIQFYRERPKTVKRAWPSVPPDLSKLIRSTEDAITEVGAWEDDSRVVQVSCMKSWARGRLPGAVITIMEAR